MPSLRESVEATREKIRRLRGQRPQKSPQQLRQEALHRGNLAYKQRLENVRLGKERNLERVNYEIQMAEYNARKKAFEDEAKRLEAQDRANAEAEVKARQMEFWRQNRERMSFVDYGSGPLPLYDTQTIGGRFVKKQINGKEIDVLESTWQQNQMSQKQELIQKQYENISKKYGETKAVAEMKKQGYDVEKKFVAPGSEELKRLPGENVEDALVRQGMSRREAKAWLSQLEKDRSGSSYKIIQRNIPGGEKRFEFKDVTNDSRNYDLAIMRDKYSKMNKFQQSVLGIATLGSSQYGKEYITSKLPYGLLGAEGSPEVKTKDVVAEEMLFLSNLQRNKPDMSPLTKFGIGVGEAIQSPPGQVAMLFLGTKGIVLGGEVIATSKAIPAVAKTAVAKSAFYGFSGMGVVYASTKYKTIAPLVQSKSYQKAGGEIVMVAGELGALSLGGRSAIREITRSKFYDLPMAEQKAGLNRLDASEIIGKSAPKPDKMTISGKNLDTKTSNVINRWLQENQLGIYTGGSQTIEPQILPKYRKGLPKSDVDAYYDPIRNPIKDIKAIETQLRNAGVKNIENLGTSLKVGGKKVMEFHPSGSHLFSNVKTVESIFKPARLQVVKDPTGIKMLKLETQMKREIIRYYTESADYAPAKRAEYKYKMDLMFKSQMDYWKGDLIPNSILGVRQYRQYQLNKVNALLSGKRQTGILDMLKAGGNMKGSAFLGGGATNIEAPVNFPTSIGVSGSRSVGLESGGYKYTTYSTNKPYISAEIDIPTSYKEKKYDVGKAYKVKPKVNVKYKPGKYPILSPIEPSKYKTKKTPVLPIYKAKPINLPKYTPKKIPKPTMTTYPTKPLIKPMISQVLYSPRARMKRKPKMPVGMWYRKYSYRPSLTGISMGGKAISFRIPKAPTGKISPIKFRYKVKK